MRKPPHFLGVLRDLLQDLQEPAGSAAGMARRVEGVSATPLARMGRIALLFAPLLIGAALFFTVWSTYRGVMTASDVLIRGEADLLHDVARAELWRMRDQPPSIVLQGVFDALEDQGLVYVAALDPDHVVAEAGKRLGSIAELEAEVARVRGGDPYAVGGDRMRAVFRRPGRRMKDGGDRGPRPALVLEYEPRTADRLQSDGRRTLAIGTLGALGLVAASLVLVRWLLRREANERRLAHERRLASLGQMSAVLAHEIRNPLASLKGNAQLLARALPPDDKPRAKADRVVAEAIRLETLVNDLLEFARSGDLHVVDTDPAALARDVATTAGNRVLVEVAGVAPRIGLDAARMRQVLGNLVDNALQADPTGAVTLGVGRSARGVQFTVRDHGTGIAPEDLEHIFEPFFTRRTRGTGLGLAVARRVVEQHGGTLRAENASDGGALFTVEIPRR
jgi:two-component system sensor histidine kinase HydH